MHWAEGRKCLYLLDRVREYNAWGGIRYHYRHFTGRVSGVVINGSEVAISDALKAIAIHLTFCSGGQGQETQAGELGRIWTNGLIYDPSGEVIIDNAADALP